MENKCLWKQNSISYSLKSVKIKHETRCDNVGWRKPILARPV